MSSKLTRLIAQLDSLTERGKLSMLANILIESGVSTSDVHDACIFNDAHYARNKITGSQWYDLFVMCWKPGQSSTIHDHADSSCALKILEGTASEIGCILTDPEKKYVRKTGISTYNKGQCCAAQDSQIHQIANLSPSQNLITMHIYSPPLKMNVYEFDPCVSMQDMPIIP